MVFAARRLAPVACRALACLLATLPALAQSSEHVGFDRNDYPGDSSLDILHRHFAFTGYWLNAPPEEGASSWLGHREVLLRAGFGFLLLWNGKLDRELLAAQQSGVSPEALGRAEAAAAARTARAERFPANAIVFLDQEEGGRLLPEQAAFLLAWTEALASLGYRPGVYASGQPVAEGATSITTAQNIRDLTRTRHLHEVALWIAQDACPPASGCTLMPPSLRTSGTPGASIWQYAQSPRRPQLTRSCAKTYRRDNTCALAELPALSLDLSVADSADPSQGR